MQLEQSSFDGERERGKKSLKSSLLYDIAISIGSEREAAVVEGKSAESDDSMDSWRLFFRIK